MCYLGSSRILVGMFSSFAIFNNNIKAIIGVCLKCYFSNSYIKQVSYWLIEADFCDQRFG
jgi:hypothetical protein